MIVEIVNKDYDDYAYNYVILKMTFCGLIFKNEDHLSVCVVSTFYAPHVNHEE